MSGEPTGLDLPSMTLAQVARLLPGSPNPSTIFRWTQRGLLIGGQRYRLKTVNIGRKIFTSTAWLREFIAATTAARDAVATAEPIRFRLPRESATLRRKSIAAANAKLGIAPPAEGDAQ